jgi:cyclophilin family peptidyl-prolyl cis-trans isomerase
LKTAPAFLLGLPLYLALLGCNGDDDSSADTHTSHATDTGSATTDASTTSSSQADSDSTSNGDGPADAESASSTDDGASTEEGSTTADGPPTVTLETSLGDIVIELDEEAAPITTANFLAYVETGFYDGNDGQGATIFHRVIPNFMIQGGGLTAEMTNKATMPPIVNESGNGLSNVRGSIAMARTNDPDSATAQFFINVVDNFGLDDPPGYAVFGAVVQGMDVVDTIVAVDTTSVGGHQNVPVEPIVILSASLH